MLWKISTDAVVMLDRASTILYANPAVAGVFGYAPEELIGQNIELLQPVRLREAHRRGLERYLATGVKRLNWRATEAHGLHRDGHEFPIEIAFSHIAQEEGDLFAAFIRDISNRKKAEEALRVGRLRNSSSNASIPTTAGGSASRSRPQSTTAAVTIPNTARSRRRQARRSGIRAIGRTFCGPRGVPIGFNGITIDITARKLADEEREALLASELAARTQAERASRTKESSSRRFRTSCARR